MMQIYLQWMVWVSIAVMFVHGVMSWSLDC